MTINILGLAKILNIRHYSFKMIKTMKEYFIKKRDGNRGEVSWQAKHRNLRDMIGAYFIGILLPFQSPAARFSNMNEMQFLTTSTLKCAVENCCHFIHY